MPFFSDDGTEINPDDLVIPDKCLKCKHYTSKTTADIEQCELTKEWEDNMMCILTRIDQREENEFNCWDYIYNPNWKTRIN